MLISFIYILCSSRASTLPLWKEEEERKCVLNRVKY